LLTSGQYPAIIKAATIDRYTVFSSGRIIDQVLNLSGSSDPLLRLNALRAINNLPPERIIPLAGPLLSDPIKAIRNEAVYVLAPFAAQLNAETRAVFETALKEYLAVQESLSHRPEGFLNKGNILAQTGKQKEAEQVYLEGLKRFPKFIALYANLADLYRAENNESASKVYLDKALSIQPANADLHYSLGLWYIRKKEISLGMTELKKAASLNPAGASIIYGYAVSLYSTGKAGEAIAVLENYLNKNEKDPQILDGLISICTDTQQPVKAAYYTQLKRSIFGN
jgi:tetratricopeptide (TPR) repeat protein